jgi:hypothetical protein
MARNLRTLWLGLPLALGLLGIAPPEVEEPAGDAGAARVTRARESVSPLATYEPDRAGHPLRIVGYALHPVGVILDYAIFRPCYWLGSHEPLRTLFGVEDD